MCLERVLRAELKIVERYRRALDGYVPWNMYGIKCFVDNLELMANVKSYPETSSGYVVCEIGNVKWGETYVIFNIYPLIYNTATRIEVGDWEVAKGNLGNGFHVWRTMHGAKDYLEKAKATELIFTAGRVAEGFAIVKVKCKMIETSGVNMVHKKFYNVFTCRKRRITDIIEAHILVDTGNGLEYNMVDETEFSLVVR